MPQHRNLILAIILSFLILFGFEYFLAPATTESESESTQIGDASPADGDGVNDPIDQAIEEDNELDEMPGIPAPTGQSLSREEILTQTPRAIINTPALTGSINLRGAQFDDLTLRNYHVDLAPDSELITLLSPRNTDHPYFVDFGWQTLETDQNIDLPNANSLWQIVQGDELLDPARTTDIPELTIDNPLLLRWENEQGFIFERAIHIDEHYLFTVEQRVINNSQTSQTLRPYGHVVQIGLPLTENFFILHEGPYGVFDDVLEEYSYDTLEEDGRITHSSAQGGWLGFTEKYWLVALAPEQHIPFTGRFFYQDAGTQTAEGVGRYFASYAEDAVTIAPGGEHQIRINLFAGPKKLDIIESYSQHNCNAISGLFGCEDREGIVKFDLSIDFGWFYFLTRPFFTFLNWLYGLVGNFGIAILLTTILVKIILFPLANKSYHAMSRMKELQPRMKELREAYGHDRQRMQTELMALYRREKINPAAGCLPILIQIPVFFALYKVLFVNIEMRHAPFFGWIQDLSAPDPTTIFNLFGLIPLDPPAFLHIGVLPIIMGLTMYIQQKLNPTPPDPLQAKIFAALPIIFTILLASFPAGLVLYWAWNNLLSILQQWIIMKRAGHRPPRDRRAGQDKKRQ